MSFYLIPKIFPCRFIEKYMEIERSGTEKGRIFKAGEESLKADGVQLISLKASILSAEIQTQNQLEIWCVI